jgi:hypothetical protein
MDPRKVPVIIEPGFLKDATSFEARNRYIDGDKIRFHDGRPEKLGGNVALNTSSHLFLGVCRSLLAHQDFSYSQWLLLGTNIRLYQYDSDYTRTNITPVEESGTLGNNPFTTTDTSTTVSVADTAHTRIVGDYVTFAGAALFNGVTISGEYQVISVTDADNYTITHSVAATGTGAGGGAAVTYSYELSAGNVSVSLGGGYGIGGYGEGGYGEDQASFVFISFPRVWHLDKYGENIIASPTGGGIYQWDPDSPNDRAVVVTNAPTQCEASFVTSERVVVALGADGDLMLVKWSDDDDITLWTPASTNIANSRRLQEGNRLVGGGRLAQRVNMIWSDTAAYLMQFTGQSNVYDTRVISVGCGLVGPKAFCVVDGIAFWWSPEAFKMFAGGQVLDVPRQADINQDVFDALGDLKGSIVSCYYNAKFNEVWWHYARDEAEENTHYVAVCLNGFSWITGEQARTAWAVRQGSSTTVYATDDDGYIYQHESGVNDNGASMAWSLETGLIDVDKANKSMNVWGYVPDFKRQVGDITVTFASYDQPRASATETKAKTVADDDTIVDLAMAGRHLKMSYAGTGVDCDIRFGVEQIEVSDAGDLR